MSGPIHKNGAILDILRKTHYNKGCERGWHVLCRQKIPNIIIKGLFYAYK